MRRLFYIAFGATAGVLLVRRLTRVAESLTPEGMARGIGGAGNRVTDALSGFFEEVRSGAAEREAELREVLGLTVPDEVPR